MFATPSSNRADRTFYHAPSALATTTITDDDHRSQAAPRAQCAQPAHRADRQHVP
jgi:hypothetical protein